MSENTVKHEHKQCGGKNIEKMEEIGKTMPVEEEIYDVAELFKVLGDQTRVKILFTLIKDEMCVCDIAHAHFVLYKGKEYFHSCLVAKDFEKLCHVIYLLLNGHCFPYFLHFLYILSSALFMLMLYCILAHLFSLSFSYYCFSMFHTGNFNSSYE